MKNAVYCIALYVILTGLPPGVIRLNQKDCPAAGNATDSAEKKLNLAKSRSTAPTPDQVERSISLEGMLNSKDNEKLFDEQKGASVEGYLYAVEEGPGESCNCNSKASTEHDYVLFIAKDDKASTTSDCAIAEITPSSRKTHSEWTLEWLKKNKGKRVAITGWMLFDRPETKNSYETRPMAFKVSRRTVWEIHPVTGFVVDE